MHKAILAAVAVVALSAPAVAQQAGHPDTNRQSETGQTAQPRPVPASPQIRADQPIAPQLLNSHQVRGIQQALEARRSGAMRVDGEWGPDVEAALRNFQKSENLISQNGELDAMTLMALGLNPLSYGLSGTAETTGQARRDGAPQQEQVQDAQEQPANIGEQNR
jgi:hypothetical protein